MAQAALLTPDLESPVEPPIAPSAARWAAMSARERDQFLEDASAALTRQAELMPEGAPHARTVHYLRSILGDYYSRLGRKIYLATNMMVVYPEEQVFCPDLLAVTEVEDPGERDTRQSWNVADERKGLDLAMEVLHSGDRKKDLSDNVTRFAQLRIPEYFVYDRLKQRIIGYRLPNAFSSRYEAIQPEGGLLRSAVLGLDLGISKGKLRFFATGAQVPETVELLARANAMLDELEARAEEAERLVEEERARVEALQARAVEAERRAEEERARADEQRARAEEERARADEQRARAEAAEARLAELLAAAERG